MTRTNNKNQVSNNCRKGDASTISASEVSSTALYMTGSRPLHPARVSPPATDAEREGKGEGGIKWREKGRAGRIT